MIRPAKLWCDVESAEEAAELSKAYGFELVPGIHRVHVNNCATADASKVAVAGICRLACLCAGFTASKILFVKNREPANYARLRHVLLPHDYVNLYLTGRLCMEASDASGTGCRSTA